VLHASPDLRSTYSGSSHLLQSLKVHNGHHMHTPVHAESMMPQAPTLTLPPDLGIRTSLGRCQTQLRQGGHNLDASKCLGEQVCGHVCGGDVPHSDDTKFTMSRNQKKRK
jgi:hypothetical protein